MIRIGGYNGRDVMAAPYFREARDRLFRYLRRPEEERLERRAPIDEGIFYDQPLRRAVEDRCRGKCVFCERRTGDELVDHFRPLRDARGLGQSVEQNFYAWLAYDFDNLILVCRECAYHKETQFPVFGARAPYIAPLPEVLRLEKPMLLDPLRDQVEQHFDFLSDGWCEPLDDRGKVSAALLGLNRDSLIRQRRNALESLLHELHDAVNVRRDLVEFRNLFDPATPFFGARLNVLKRVLAGLTFRGRTLTGPVASLPRRLEAAVRFGLADAEMRRFSQRLQDLRREDEERERWTGELNVRSDEEADAFRAERSPWDHVRRNGGLAHIHIANFKGVGSLTLPISFRRQSKTAPCLMLLGENAVGKSSILQAIALALLGGPESRKLRLNPMDLLRTNFDERWDQLTPEDAVVQLGFRFDSTAHFVLNAEERTIRGREPPSAIVLAYGPRRFFDRDKSDPGTAAFSRVQTLFKPTATIAYPGTWLKGLTRREFQQVAQVIRVVLALDDDDDLVQDLDGRICVRIGRRPVPLEWLSEGYRSIFVMVADIARELMPRFRILEEAEAIVLIDEIETHLHPRWKMQVMSALRRALPNVQFIVTTHDPLCLRGMDDGEVVVLQRDPSGDIEQLQGLPSIRGMRADQLLTSDYFGLSSTIDPQSELDMARYVEAIDDAPEGQTQGAERLIKHLTVGDDAQEQVLHRAMQRFIAERERPMDRLRTDISEQAVEAVLAALRRGRQL